MNRNMRTEAEKRKLVKKIQKGIDSGGSTDDLAQEHGIHNTQFYDWRRKLGLAPPGTKRRSEIVKSRPYKSTKKPITIEIPEETANMCIMFGPVDKIAHALKVIGGSNGYSNASIFGCRYARTTRCVIRYGVKK